MKDDDMRLDAIFEHKMSRLEADVFKICLFWEDETKRLFPGENYAKLPKRSDPRKSHLFRYCWKMLRETRGILQEQHRKMYVTANLTGIKKHGGRVDPNILCGDRAWWRWKVYKWLYEKALAFRNGETPPPSAITTSPKVVQELELTKKFLFERCEGRYTEEKLKEFITSGILKLWALRKKVSPYYIVQSPVVQKYADIDQLGQDCWFDPKLIAKQCTPDVREYFRHEFDHEFGESK